MGGKRPDQYQIDPGEAGATDYKSRHEDEGITEREKRELTTDHTDDKYAAPQIPRSGENPARSELKAKRARRATRRGKEE